MELSENIKSVLREGGYEINFNGSGYQISKIQGKSWVGTIFSFAVGFAVLFLAIQLVNIWLALFGVVLFGWPLIKRSWSYPDKVFINSVQGVLTIKGILLDGNYSLSELSSIEVDERIVSSDVSPFKEGYRDFFYNFFLYHESGKLRFLQLAFRSEQSQQLGDLVIWLSHTLQIS